MTKGPVELLLSRLAFTAEARKSPHAVTTDPNAQRVVPIAALSAVMLFLTDIDAPQGAINALGDLLGALDDINNGRKNTLLKPAAYDRKKARIPAKRLSQLWTAAAAATMLIDAGEERELALREASRAAGTGWKKLDTFLTAVQMCRRGDEARQYYEKTLAVRERFPNLDPKDVAKQLLANIKDQR